MRGAGAVARLKAFYRQMLDDTPEAAQQWMDELAKETDRTVIILCSTLVEDALAKAIKAKMPHLSPAEMEKLFDFDRAFGTFSRLIDVAHALQIIRSRERDSCHLLREMRNAAAHAQSHLDFSTPQIVDVMQAFAGADIPETPALRRLGFIGLAATLSEIITYGVQEAFNRTSKWTEEAGVELHTSKNIPSEE